MELLKLSMLICDSFNRHRWHALESGASHGDSGASSLIAHQQGSLASSKDAAVKDATKSTGKQAFEAAPPVRQPSTPTKRLSRVDNFDWPESSLRTLHFNALEHPKEELAQFVPMMMQHTGCVEGC